MKNKIIYILIILLTMTGCGAKTNENKEDTNNHYASLIDYQEALKILKEDTTASVLDIKTGITYEVKRVVGGFNTLADIETTSADETAKLLSTIDNKWNIIRRPVIVTIGDTKIAASISPFPHSGSEEKPYGDIIDNRSGSTGTGINLDSIRENNLIGVLDIYFYNSLTPGVNRVDERHQEMVLEAYNYDGKND